MGDLFVWTAGAGRRVLCVHGSGSSGSNWLAIAEAVPGYHIVAPDRSNYGRSPVIGPAPLDAAVDRLEKLLDDGAHLLGQSYGGLLCLLLAARRPERVRSLTVNEPPAFQLAPDDPAVREMRDRLIDVYPPRPDDTPSAWNVRWARAAGMEPDDFPLTPAQEHAVRAMMWEQPPWEAEIDLERIAGAPFPALILSGGWSAAFSAVCDVLEARLGARRVDFPGASHSLSANRERWLPIVRELWRSVDG
jgi:pimeloyl-ACP methyl ester carboxylesterase